MKIPILFFCMLIGAVVGQSIVESPSDTSGIIGGTATFVCIVDYGLRKPEMNWQFNNVIIASYDQYSWLYSGITYTNDVRHYDNYYTFTLKVWNLNYLDGGNYICEVFDEKKSAALVVLGSPVITQETTKLIDGKTAMFKCQARFGGSSTNQIFPKLQLVLDDDIYQAYYQTHTEMYILKYYEILVEDTMDTKELKCVIETTNSEPLTSSTILDVHYSVRNITFLPQKDVYVLGSSITCSARGNPKPQFEWRNSRSNTGQLLNIDEDMEGRDSWTCTARNTVDGRMYEKEITAKFETAPAHYSICPIQEMNCAQNHIVMNCAQNHIVIKEISAEPRVADYILLQCNGHQKCKVKLKNDEYVEYRSYCLNNVQNIMQITEASEAKLQASAGVHVMSEKYQAGKDIDAKDIQCELTFSNRSDRTMQFTIFDFASSANSDGYCLRFKETNKKPVCSGSQKLHSSYGPFISSTGFQFTLTRNLDTAYTAKIRFWFAIAVAPNDDMFQLKCSSKGVTNFTFKSYQSTTSQLSDVLGFYLLIGCLYGFCSLIELLAHLR